MKRLIIYLTSAALLFGMTGCFMDAEEDVSDMVSDSTVNSTSRSDEIAVEDETSEVTPDDTSESDVSDESVSNDSNVDADMHNVEVINETGGSVYGLSHSETGLDEWGDPLHDEPIEDGMSANVSIPRGEADARYDLRVYDNEDMSGDGWIFPDIDFTRDGRIILRYKEDAPDYVYGDDYDNENSESESLD